MVYWFAVAEFPRLNWVSSIPFVVSLINVIIVFVGGVIVHVSSM